VPTSKLSDEAGLSRERKATSEVGGTVVDWTSVGTGTSADSDGVDRSFMGLLTGDRTWFKALVAVVALVGSLIAVVGGSLALVDHWKRGHPDLTISVAHDLLDDPHLLRVELVNDSAAATTLVGGKVFVDNDPVGTILATIDAGAEGLNGGIRTRFLPDGTRPLPFSLPAGSSFSGALVWDEGSFYLPDVVKAFTKTVDSPGSQRGPNRLRIRLEFRPGGVKVRTIELPPIRLEDQFRPPFGHGRGWSSRPVLDGTRGVAGLRVTYEAGTPAVGVLRLWNSAGSGPVRTITRPLVGGRSAFIWNRVKPGRYEWAISTDAGVVAVGTFISPCTPDKRVEAALMCAVNPS
jgi:hypothetical protein